MPTVRYHYAVRPESKLDAAIVRAVERKLSVEVYSVVSSTDMKQFFGNFEDAMDFVLTPFLAVITTDEHGNINIATRLALGYGQAARELLCAFGSTTLATVEKRVKRGK